MTRTILPYSAPDLSALARLLERAILDHHVTHGRLPGHVEMMNLLARGAGKRNLQALQADAARAAQAAPSRPPTPPPAEDDWFDAPDIDAPEAPAAAPPELGVHARKAIQQFDGAGRLVRWPPKLSVQRLVMWVLWTRFDARRVYTEAEVNRVLKAWHLYGDHATLRRELVNHKLMTRKPDCSEYRKLALRPDAEVQALLRALRSDTRAPRARRPAPPVPAASAAPAP
jgi:hypothetical protein